MDLISQLKTNVNVYERLIDGGYADARSRLATSVKPTEITYTGSEDDASGTDLGRASPIDAQRR